MTNKYIIKNCPARNNGYFKDCVGTYHNECQDCTDCLLKQIVEMCRQPNEPYYNSECEYGIGRIDMGEDILELLEIQECE